MKLVIDRKTWLRGEGQSNSCLKRHADGKQCCLGFYALALGHSATSIVSRSMPVSVEDPLFPEWALNMERSSDVIVLSRTNDYPGNYPNNEAQREIEVAAIFAKHDVEVVFVDEPEQQA